MLYAAARRMFVGLLAVICSFVNLTATPTRNNTPQDALSVVYADTVCGDLKLFLPESFDTQKPTDVLLTIHGGAWVSGGAQIFYNDCRAAARRFARIVSDEFGDCFKESNVTPEKFKRRMSKCSDRAVNMLLPTIINMSREEDK